jgi:hypothetical protein
MRYPAFNMAIGVAHSTVSTLLFHKEEEEGGMKGRGEGQFSLLTLD